MTPVAGHGILLCDECTQQRSCTDVGPPAAGATADAGRGRARYVPAALAGVVRRYLQRGEQVEAVLAEISAINAELLARRELR